MWSKRTSDQKQHIMVSSHMSLSKIPNVIVTLCSAKTVAQGIQLVARYLVRVLRALFKVICISFHFNNTHEKN